MNTRLDGEPALANSDPYGEGWMIKMKVNPADVAALMDAAAYTKHLG